MAEPWWSNAVFYQVYPRSFADSDGDGVGDLDGVTGRLGLPGTAGRRGDLAQPGHRLADGRPWLRRGGSARHRPAVRRDAARIERLIAAAHELGIKVTMDLVPNHTSSAHPWFQAALVAGPGSRGAGTLHLPRGQAAPTGRCHRTTGRRFSAGPAWTRVVEPDGNPGQWYLHLFDAEQPDLNWENPEVFDDFEKTLRFWLDRGVDGFRIDVAHGMAKPPGLPDMKDDVKIAELTATTIRGSTTRACTRSTAGSARSSTTIPTR